MNQKFVSVFFVWCGFSVYSQAYGRMVAPSMMQVAHSHPFVQKRNLVLHHGSSHSPQRIEHHLTPAQVAALSKTLSNRESCHNSPGKNCGQSSAFASIRYFIHKIFH
jgi:hypothetical protein